MMAGTGNPIGGLQHRVPREVFVGGHGPAAVKDAIDDAVDVADVPFNTPAQANADAALHPVGLIGGYTEGKLLRRHIEQHVVDNLCDPGGAGQRPRMGTVVFRIRHHAQEIGAVRQRGVIVDAGKGAVAIGGGVILGAGGDGHAHLLAVGVQGAGHFSDKAREGTALGGGQVFKIQLPADEILRARGAEQRADGTIAGGGRAQKPLGAVAREVGVDHQRHHGHAMGAGNGGERRGHRAAQHAVAVQRKALRREYTHRTGMLGKARHCRRTRHAIEKCLHPRCRGYGLGANPAGQQQVYPGQPHEPYCNSSELPLARSSSSSLPVINSARQMAAAMRSMPPSKKNLSVGSGSLRNSK